MTAQSMSSILRMILPSQYKENVRLDAAAELRKKREPARYDGEAHFDYVAN